MLRENQFAAIVLRVTLNGIDSGKSLSFDAISCTKTHGLGLPHALLYLPGKKTALGMPALFL
jgi:hypothetical protein